MDGSGFSALDPSFRYGRVARVLASVVLALTLTACAEPRPTAGVTLSPGGNATGAVGVDAGRVHGGVTTGGTPYAGVDVVERPNVGVSVGTGGASATVGNGPVRLRVGRGGVGVRL